MAGAATLALAATFEPIEAAATIIVIHFRRLRPVPCGPSIYPSLSTSFDPTTPTCIFTETRSDGSRGMRDSSTKPSSSARRRSGFYFSLGRSGADEPLYSASPPSPASATATTFLSQESVRNLTASHEKHLKDRCLPG